jgi:hypothetical protein
MLMALGVVLLLGVAWAQLPPAEPSTEKLIEQLGSRSYREREAASRALESRGDSTLEPMRKAATTTKNPETRWRLQALITRLERSQILSPKRVTLNVNNQPIGDAINEIAKQTGYAIQYQGNNRNHPVSYEFRNRPFWDVIDRICMDGGLMLQHNEPAGFVLYQNDSVWPYVCRSGPFKMVANSFYYTRTVTLGGLPRNPAQQQSRHESLQFSFNIQSEPKLPMMQVHAPKLLEAVDDRGQSLVMPAQNGQETVYYGHNGYRTLNYSTQVPLAPPAKEARMLRILRGSLPVQLLAEQRPDIIVDDILKVKNKKFTGTDAEIHIDEIKDTNNKTSFSVKMTIRNLSKNAAQDYSWTNSVHQRLELLDAKGNKYHSHGYNWENSSPTNVTATFMFGSNGVASIGPPSRLVFNMWSLMQHQIEFEFRDLPLP